MAVNPIALITGATAGIGAAFARQLASRGYDLVLVARDGGRLGALANTLAREYRTDAVVLDADLSTVVGCAVVEERLGSEHRPVDLLVNNAGSSLNQSFLASGADDEERLLRLNVVAVLRLTHAALPLMVARGAGSVINVSSVSGFAAVMAGSTYPASKSWVTNFSESVDLLVRPLGVRVMALCPGYTRTEFHARQGIDISNMPDWLWLDADKVVRDGLRDLRGGRSVSVPGWRYKIAVSALRHAPRGLIHRLARDGRGRIRPQR